MTDEHLMRHWTDAHSDFSGDLDRGMLRLGRFVTRRLNRHATDNSAYASAAPANANPVARAAMAGAMACLATTFLMLSLALAATAGTHSAAGLAFVDHVILA